MIIGHQKQWKALKKIALGGKLAHALLFQGQDKLGKRRLALELIKFLNCESLQKKPCQECKNCRDIENNSYPDLSLLEPQGKEIKISQIRSLIEKLSLRAYHSEYKTALIDEAHLMSRASQNCFLKFLEEPKGKTLVVLITAYPQLLLPTITSRVQKISFQPVERKEIEDYLLRKGSSKKKAEIIASLSLNKPGEAVDFLSYPQKVKEWEKNKVSLEKIIRSDLAFRFQYAKKLSEEESGPEILKIWLVYLREALLNCLNKEEKPESLGSCSAEKIKNMIKDTQDSLYLITHTNANTRLVFENLLREF